MTDPKPWTPPFCSIDADELECPACKETGHVQVREKETYFDASEVEAYCSSCHATLEVWASVDVTFHDPEVAK